jgi:uncharacterized RmlC-like cupin family protein
VSELVRLIRPDEREASESTRGMIREQAIAAEGMWSGFVRTAAGTASGWHHHGDYVSSIYVVSGSVRLEFGAGGRDSVDARTGDFVYVPRGAIHREVSEEDCTAVVVRAGQGEPVFNVDGPEAP